MVILRLKKRSDVLIERDSLEERIPDTTTSRCRVSSIDSRTT
jgi:hypothetical protein